jgi:CheY-like chemotaxis protein
MQNTGIVAVFVDDMFFAAKISSAAQAAGVQAKRFRSLDQLNEQAGEQAHSLAIIDLNSDRIDAIELIRSLKSGPPLNRIPLVGFLSHVQVDLMRAAEEAGCDYVLPRSAFAAMLPDIVSRNLERLRAGSSS